MRSPMDFGYLYWSDCILLRAMECGTVLSIARKHWSFPVWKDRNRVVAVSLCEPTRRGERAMCFALSGGENRMSCHRTSSHG
jgi:hypothetical protein